MKKLKIPIQRPILSAGSAPDSIAYGIDRILAQATPIVNSKGKPLLKFGDTLQRIKIGIEEYKNQNNIENQIKWNSGIPLIEIKADAESIQIFKVIKGYRAK